MKNDTKVLIEQRQCEIKEFVDKHEVIASRQGGSCFYVQPGNFTGFNRLAGGSMGRPAEQETVVSRIRSKLGSQSKSLYDIKLHGATAKVLKEREVQHHIAFATAHRELTGRDIKIYGCRQFRVCDAKAGEEFTMDVPMQTTIAATENSITYLTKLLPSKEGNVLAIISDYSDKESPQRKLIEVTPEELTALQDKMERIVSMLNPTTNVAQALKAEAGNLLEKAVGRNPLKTKSPLRLDILPEQTESRVTFVTNSQGGLESAEYSVSKGFWDSVTAQKNAKQVTTSVRSSYPGMYWGAPNRQKEMFLIEDSVIQSGAGEIMDNIDTNYHIWAVD